MKTVETIKGAFAPGATPAEILGWSPYGLEMRIKQLGVAERAGLIDPEAADWLRQQIGQVKSDLAAGRQTEDVARWAGIKSAGYPTVANGWVEKYQGTALVHYPDGKIYAVVGFGPDGDAHTIYRDGYIKWIPVC